MTGDGERLRILFVAPYVPSPIRVRPYQFVRHLVKAGHEVTVAALSDGLESEAAAVAELREICREVHIVPHPKNRALLNCLTALPTPTPLWAAYCHSPQMARLLRELSSSGAFDVAHVEHLRAAHFASDLGRLPKVFDAVDCITALRRQMMDQSRKGTPARLLSWEEWAKLRRYEPRAYRPFARIVVTSQHDADALASLGNDSGGGGAFPPIEVIPNGVDLDYFRPDPAIPTERDTLVFSGKMSYLANDDAARFLLTQVLPRVKARRPQAKLLIVGSGPTSALRTLAARTPDTVTVTGYVEDLRPYLARAQAAVCPMRIGVGIQNKALEAMAMGKAVVCSPLAARALVGASAGGAVRVVPTDDPEQFAGACAELLACPEDAETMGATARRYVEERHRWERAAHDLVRLYREAGAGDALPAAN